MSDEQLLAQLATGRRHVLRALDGLADDAMHQVIVPSGWTITRLLNHLAFDNEMFWISAVLGGDTRAIEALHDGWATDPMTGTEAIEAYKREFTRSDEVLANIDLDAPPCWNPPPSVLDAPQCVTDARSCFASCPRHPSAQAISTLSGNSSSATRTS